MTCEHGEPWPGYYRDWPKLRCAACWLEVER